MPDKLFMIVGRSRKHGISGTDAAKMIVASRYAIDREQKKAAFRDPRRHIVRQACARRKTHLTIIISKERFRKKPALEQSGGALGTARPTNRR